jgi:hypothetical protein
MPGLLGGIARTAVIAGTATAVSNRVSRRQANRWAQQSAPPAQQAPQAPPPQYAAVVAAPAPQYAAAVATPQAVDRVAQLKGLAELKADGILTDAEFESEKAKILAS